MKMRVNAVFVRCIWSWLWERLSIEESGSDRRAFIPVMLLRHSAWVPSCLPFPIVPDKTNGGTFMKFVNEKAGE